MTFALFWVLNAKIAIQAIGFLVSVAITVHGPRVLRSLRLVQSMEKGSGAVVESGTNAPINVEFYGLLHTLILFRSSFSVLLSLYLISAGKMTVSRVLVAQQRLT